MYSTSFLPDRGGCPQAPGSAEKSDPIGKKARAVLRGSPILPHRSVLAPIQGSDGQRFRATSKQPRNVPYTLPSRKSAATTMKKVDAVMRTPLQKKQDQTSVLADLPSHRTPAASQAPGGKMQITLTRQREKPYTLPERTSDATPMEKAMESANLLRRSPSPEPATPLAPRQRQKPTRFTPPPFQKAPQTPPRSKRSQHQPERFSPGSLKTPPASPKGLPGKAWSVKRVNGKIQIGPSPKSGKITKTLYSISRKDSKKGHDFYIGSSLNTLRGRFSKYRGQVNTPERPKTNPQKRRHIEHAVHRSPEAFRVKVIAELPKDASRLDLLKAEKVAVEKFKPRYNHGSLDAEIKAEETRIKTSKQK